MEKIYETLRKQAENAGDKPALMGIDGQAWSWKELFEEVENLMGLLRMAGIGKEDRVALVLEDGPEMALAFLAVSSTCACAPLNPAYRARDFAFYLDDLQARAVIVAAGDDREVSGVAAERGIPLLELSCNKEMDTPCLELKGVEAGPVPSGDSLPGPGSVALVLHTSGTTSRPKMVPLTHKNLLTSAANVAATLELTPADRGYFDEEGYLFLTGRLKEMINRGGENIAPREVDEVLLEHPAVAHATAFAIPHETLGEDLAAAVVLRDGASATEQEMRRHVADSLVPFKVPNRVVFVSSIPKGPTGKLQRIGLHEKLAHALKTDFVAPRTGTEARIVQLFKDALQVDKIGVLDNFFFSGGDSLRATRVVNALRKEFPGDLPLTLVFLNPTAEQLAAYLDTRGEPGEDIDALARELESLSPEEIEKLLSEED